MPINAEWHRAHLMPPNAKFEARAAWHLDHVKHCGCRAIPAKLAEQMRDRGMLPDDAPVDPPRAAR